MVTKVWSSLGCRQGPLGGGLERVELGEGLSLMGLVGASVYKGVSGRPGALCSGLSIRPGSSYSPTYLPASAVQVVVLLSWDPDVHAARGS